jgi:2-methylcitrate dehydratase PrpD
VTITLKGGGRHVCRIDHCIGSASNPMTDQQLARKFTDLADPVVGAQRGAALLERAWAAETLADIGELARAAA